LTVGINYGHKYKLLRDGVLVECNNSIKKLINSYEIFNIEASSTVLKLIN